MLRSPARFHRTCTLFPYTTLFRFLSLLSWEKPTPLPLGSRYCLIWHCVMLRCRFMRSRSSIAVSVICAPPANRHRPCAMTAGCHRGGLAVKQVHQRGCAAVGGARGHAGTCTYSVWGKIGRAHV